MADLGRFKAILTSRVGTFTLLLLATVGLLYSFWSLGGPAYVLRDEDASPSQPAHSPTIPKSTLHISNTHGDSQYCKGVPNSNNIVVIVKTGATEATDKLPAHLLTSLRCIPDPILVSDLEQTIGRHKIHDVISRMVPEAMDKNPDFEIYHMQQTLIANGQGTELHRLSNLPIAHKGWRTPGKSAAWGLDKYKFLHEIELAWELQPDKDWYVFIEADTYLSWRNLNTFLADFDPKESWYFGSPVQMHEHPTPLWFAYGGAGFILSGRVLKDWATDHPGMANEWDTRIFKMWFGDFVVADALDEKLRVHVTDATPMMHPDEPALVPFGEQLWCKPIVTLHHLDSRQLDEVYQTEIGHKGNALLFKDIYRSTYSLGLPFKREDWDNRADDKKYAIEVVPNEVDDTHGQWEPKDLVDPHKSYQNCELACTRNEACFQFTFATVSNVTGEEPLITTACHLSKVFRLGNKREMESWVEKEKWEKTWISGWRSDRIAKWVEDHRACP